MSDLWYLIYNNIMKKCKLHIPEPCVWLMEDNTPLHSKAAQVCKDREERGIRKVDWPVNSPDLRRVEEIWYYTDAALEPQWCEISSARKEAQKSSVQGNHRSWGVGKYTKGCRRNW